MDKELNDIIMRSIEECYTSDRGKAEVFRNNQNRLRANSIEKYRLTARKYYKKRVKSDQYLYKLNARETARRAVRNGKLKKKPCQECGSIDTVDAHHSDYSKPLHVEWLCRACHSELHYRENRQLRLIKKIAELNRREKLREVKA